MAYIPSKSLVLTLWNRLAERPLGKWLVGKIICFKAPYFATIKPRFTHIAPGKVEITFKKRRSVLNHINSVHAIAMCNAAELAGGICMDVSLHAKLRWIPIGMRVEYLKKAKSDLRAVCELSDYSWEHEQVVDVPVVLVDSQGDTVFEAHITMKLSPKK